MTEDAGRSHQFDPEVISGAPSPVLPPTAGIEAALLAEHLSQAPLIGSPAEARGGAYERVLDVPAPSVTRREAAPPQPSSQHMAVATQNRPATGAPVPTPTGAWRRDAAATARDVADRISIVARRGTAPGLGSLMLSLLREWDADDVGLRALVAELRARGALVDFLDFARYDAVWDELRRRGLDEQVLLDNMASIGPLAATGIMLGVVAGMAKDFAMTPVHVWDAVSALAGSTFNGTLREDAAALATALRGLLTNLEVVKRLPVGWKDELNRRLARREWERAGIMIGEVIMTTIDAVTLGSAVTKGGSKLAKGVATLVDGLPTFAVSAMLKASTSADVTRWSALARGQSRLVQLSSGSAEVIGDAVVIRNADGVAEAKAAWGSTTVDELLRAIDDRVAELDGKGADDVIARSVSPLDALLAAADKIAGAVRDAVPDVPGRAAATTGTLRHTEAFKLLEAWADEHAPKLQVHPKTKMRDVPGFDPAVARMTVGEFLHEHGLARELRGKRGAPPARLDGIVGDLEVDMFAVDPSTGQGLVWDLTGSPGAASHLSKTMLYAHVLSRGVRGTLFRIAEAYHRPTSLRQPPHRGP